jgi:hypothetical protein
MAVEICYIIFTESIRIERIIIWQRYRWVKIRR